MPSRKSAACTIALLTGLVWSACSSDPPLPLARTAGCTLNSDCSSPLACIFQRCHGVCTETRDCEKGERCLKLDPHNVCQLPDEVACTFTSDCPAPLKCAVDSKCRVACQTAVDCLPTQVCTNSVCADHDELLLTGSLPVTNANGYSGADDGGNVVTGEGSAGSSDAGPDVSSTGTIDAGSDDGKAPTIDVSPDVAISPDAAITPCGDGGVLSKFAPSNLPSGFAIPGDAGPRHGSSPPATAFSTRTPSRRPAAAPGSRRRRSISSDGRSAAVISAASVTVSTGARITFTGRRPAIVLANGKIDINGGVKRQNATNGWFGGGAPGTPTGDRVGFCALETGPGGGGKGDSTAAGSGAGGGAFCGSGGRGSIRADAGAGAPGGAPYGRADPIPLVGGWGEAAPRDAFTAVQGTNHGGGAVELVAGGSIMVGELRRHRHGRWLRGRDSWKYRGRRRRERRRGAPQAPSVTIRGVVAVNGAGGGGGYLQAGQEGQPSATPAAGGGIGGKGAAGSTANGSDAQPWVSGRSGGGGGGAGRIRINTGCGGSLTVTAAAVISPDSTSGCFTEGTLH